MSFPHWCRYGFRDFRQAEQGAALLIFSMTLVIVVGALAFAVDATRYFAVKSRLSVATEQAAKTAARNVHFLSTAALEDLANRVFQSAFHEFNPISMTGNAAVVPIMSLQVVAETGQVTAHAQATVEATLLNFLGLFEEITVARKVTAWQYRPESELVLVIDGSEEMETSGKLALVKMSASAFISAFGNQAVLDAGLGLSLIPFGNAYMNVAPHNEWVQAGLWPINIPPLVPGTTEWAGDLAEERWCVDVRSGASGENDIPPDADPFQPILDISADLDPDTGLPHFKVTTTAACRAGRLRPLTTSHSDIMTAIMEMTGTGSAAAGRASVWAERILSPLWRTAWGAEAIPAVDYENSSVRKVVVLVMGTDISNYETESVLMQQTCTRLKDKGVTIYTIDFSASPDTSILLEQCGSSKGHYFQVNDGPQLTDAFMAIAKFMTIVRLGG